MMKLTRVKWAGEISAEEILRAAEEYIQLFLSAGPVDPCMDPPPVLRIPLPPGLIRGFTWQEVDTALEAADWKRIPGTTFQIHPHYRGV